jgi:hypothetical protein
MTAPQNKITIYGPKGDGKYLIEFRTVAKTRAGTPCESPPVRAENAAASMEV